MFLFCLAYLQFLLSDRLWFMVMEYDISEMVFCFVYMFFDVLIYCLFHFKARAIPDHVIVEGSINKFHVSWGTVGDNRNLNKTIVIWCVGKDYHCEVNKHFNHV